MLLGILNDINNDNENPRKEQAKKGLLETCKEIGALNDVELCRCSDCSAPEIKVEKERNEDVLEFLKKIGVIKEDYP